jgi:hypothetical protein
MSPILSARGVRVVFTSGFGGGRAPARGGGGGGRGGGVGGAGGAGGPARAVDPWRARRIPAGVLVEALLEKARPHLEETGDLAFVTRQLARLTGRGTGSERQRAAAHHGVRSVISVLADQALSADGLPDAPGTSAPSASPGASAPPAAGTAPAAAATPLSLGGTS